MKLRIRNRTDAQGNVIDTVSYGYSAFPDATIPGLNFAVLSTVDSPARSQTPFGNGTASDEAPFPRNR